VPPISCLRGGWFHPWPPGREHVSRCLPAQGNVRKSGAGGGTRTLTSVSSTDFLTVLRLSPPGRGFLVRTRQVCGLDYPFTVSRKVRGLGAARLVSTPSRRTAHRAWLGIAISGFPEFEQFCIAGFPDEHSSFLKSVASAISPRPHGRLTTIAVYHSGAAECTRQLSSWVSADFFVFPRFGLMTLITAASSRVLIWAA
jgi:hypothetical protein